MSVAHDAALADIEVLIERNQKLQRKRSTTEAEKRALKADLLYLMRERSDIQVQMEREKTEAKMAASAEEIQQLVDVIGALLGEPKKA